MTDHKALNQICIISRHEGENGERVCLLDMQQVMGMANQLGLSHLAEIVQKDLEENKIVDGNYYSLIAPMFGEMA